MKPTYTKLILQDSELIAVPSDYAERHELVRVEIPLLAQPIIVAAYALPSKAYKAGIAAAEKHAIYGRSMRAPTPEEAFLICDRSQFPALPKLYFPDIEEAPWTWTSQPYAARSGAAWVVYLVNGDASWYGHDDLCQVRAVCAGQS